MIPVEKLRAQNEELEETCRVLAVLITDTSVCDTRICREIFTRFSEQVRAHFDLEDRTLYSDLLVHRDRHINGLATRFLDSSCELKRIFTDYLGRWSGSGAKLADRERFVAETEEMIHILMKRLKVENEEMLPLVGSLQAA